MVFGGLFAAFTLSFILFVMFPQIHLGNLQPQVDEEAGDIYPINAGGEAAQGREVYAANGCIYCHTQQVRDDADSPDIARGWGPRRTVARDYIYEQPVLLGVLRTGPDLTNIGTRKDPKDAFKYSAAWHYQHLYDPRTVSPGSIMPSYAYLFERRKILGQRAADALELKGSAAPEAGWEIVPGPQARALVGYLMSLDRTHPLKEAGPQQAPAPSPPPLQTAGQQPTAPGGATK
jgi:cytochrome c oxidase cbb3-type subunit II